MFVSFLLLFFPCPFGDLFHAIRSSCTEIYLCALHFPQNEFLADCDNRRAYISGFTGSAGTAIVTENEAYMWTDGRYFLQATEEMDQNWTLMREG
jgi:hypothetical protein